MKQIKRQYKRIGKIIAIFTLIVFTVLSNLQLPIKANSNQPVTIGSIPGTGAILSQGGRTAWWSAIDKISVNGEIAFCVEPMVIGLNGTYSASDFDTNIKNTLSKIVYHGWDNTGKTDNDYATTQFMIWESLGATITQWQGSFGNSYPTLKANVQSKIDNHNIKPSFHGTSNYEINVNETISFYDDNYVINQFHVKDSGGTSAWIENNQLHVIPNENTPDNTTITLQKFSDEHVGASIAYRSSASNGQDVGVFKISDPGHARVTIKVNKFGSLEITKLDEENNLIPGTSYKLSYNADMSNPIGIYTTGTDGKIRIDNLKGNTVVYYQEVDVPNSLIIDSTINSVTIPMNDVITVTQINNIQKGKITAKKVDKDTGVAHGNATLQGAIYRLYANTDIVNPVTGAIIHPAETLIGERTTNEYGNMQPFENLYLGSYYLQEQTASDGYLVNPEKMVVDLNYAGQTETIVSESVTSQETIKRGQFSLSKGVSHDVTGSSEILKPEVDAEFITVLKKYVDQYGTVEDAYAHKDEYAVDEYDLLITDKNGNAQSKELAYGTYVSKQIKGEVDSLLLEDTWETVIDGDKNNEKHYLIKNQAFQPYLKIVKKDKETQEVVTSADGIYKIRNIDTGEFLTQKLGNKYISEFQTEQGIVVLPLRINPGNYELIEVKAPDGYTIESAPVPFKITQTNIHETDKDGDPIYVVEISNQRVKGQVEVRKGGLALSKYENGKFIYEERTLPGAEFTLYARKNIVDIANGNIIYKKDVEIAKQVTDETGIAIFKDLPLGEYYVKETQAPSGYVIDEQKYDITVAYENENTPTVKVSIGVYNPKQNYEINIFKIDEESKKALSGAEFTLYANRDVYNFDQELIVPAGTALEVVTSDSKGNVTFTLDLPTDFADKYSIMPINYDEELDPAFNVGYNYIDGVELYGNPNSLFVVKETQAPEGYELKEANYYVDVAYQENVQSVEIIHEATNKQIKATIQVNKIDTYSQEAIISKDFAFGIYKDEACSNLLKKEHANTEDGTATFNNVEYGTYFIKEIEAPIGYLLSDEIVKVEIKEDGVFINGQKVKEENQIYSFVYYNSPLQDDVVTGDDANKTTLIFLSSISILIIGYQLFDIAKRKKKYE